jgi:2-phospho-L-lactate transferase/gluconeogenesis factor (CofD/UPF0052 family)
MTQPGETDGYGFSEHLAAVRRYAPQIHFDFTVVNDRAISSDQAQVYAADGAAQVLLDKTIEATLREQGIEVMKADLLDDGDMVRHNSDRLARVVLQCASNLHPNKLPAEMLTV